MNANNYFLPLLTSDFQSLSQTAIIANLTIDSMLYTSLIKSIPPNILTILAMKNNNKSGGYVIKNLTTRTLKPNSTAQIVSLYLK